MSRIGTATDAMSLFDFTVKDAHGKDAALAEHRGKVCLVVNVASRCGFTPQYKGLVKLQNEFKDRRFTVLGFPCNQFLSQEPGSAEQVCEFAQSVYSADFPIYGKINVNGSDAAPVYEFLKASAPGIFGTRFIKWNFTKFLVDHNGKPIKRYSTTTPPESIAADIEALLGNAKSKL